MIPGKLASVLLLAVLLGSASQRVSAQVDSTDTATLLVPAGGCVGHSWGQNGDKLDYSVQLMSLGVPATCDATASVRISKIYVEGACASSRDNSLACAPTLCGSHVTRRICSAACLGRPAVVRTPWHAAIEAMSCFRVI